MVSSVLPAVLTIEGLEEGLSITVEKDRYCDQQVLSNRDKCGVFYEMKAQTSSSVTTVQETWAASSA